MSDVLQYAREPVVKDMAPGAELSNFVKGMIFGYHLSGLPSRWMAIAINLNRPQPPDQHSSCVNTKWRDTVAIPNVPHDRNL